MQRVLVIGPCGAGKSTLGVELGQKVGLPVFHMDQLDWQPGRPPTLDGLAFARNPIMMPPLPR